MVHKRKRHESSRWAENVQTGKLTTYAKYAALPFGKMP